jgi:uncharacterized protein YjbI with pentapeptide repeats
VGQDQEARKRTFKWVVGLVVALVLVIILYGGYRYGWKWTGIVEDDNYPTKTLWDWLKLLIIPAAIAGGTIWFNQRQQTRAQQLADAQQRQERDNAKKRAEDEALQQYLDSMTELLTGIGLREQEDKQEDEQGLIARGLARVRKQGEDTVLVREQIVSARVLAQARTLSVLPRLDGDRKGTVLQFLYEANLINHSKKDGQNTFGLESTERAIRDEQGVISLTRADLTGANLESSHLFGAALSHSNLQGANLRYAELRAADLRHCDLRGADLTNAILSTSSLRVLAAMGVDFIRNPMSALYGFGDPFQSTAVGEIVKGAMGSAQLDGANLQDVTGVTTEQLLNQAKDKDGISLAGAIMPDGRKYEDCLKDKKGRGENGRTAALPNDSE